MVLMLAITEYDYLKPATGVPAERSIHNLSFDYERNRKYTSIIVIAEEMCVGGQWRCITVSLDMRPKSGITNYCMV